MTVQDGARPRGLRQPSVLLDELLHLDDGVERGAKLVTEPQRARQTGCGVGVDGQDVFVGSEQNNPDGLFSAGAVICSIT